MNASRLSVLHVISGDLWAGAEAQALSLLRELRTMHGVDLEVVVLNPGRLGSELHRLGIPTHVFDESKHSSLSILRSLRRLLRERRFQIVHAHRYKENVLAGLASRRMPRPMLVRTVHGLVEQFGFWDGLKVSFYGFLERVVTDLWFDAVHCVSEQIRTVISKRHRRARVVCIHNGISASACAPTATRPQVLETLGLPSETQLLLTAGRLVPVKGLPYLIEALPSVARRARHACLLIAGDGPERTHLEHRVIELGLADRVRFLGHRHDIMDLLAASDLLVLPSLSEGVPMILLEAMCLKAAIVATRVGGIPEVLQHDHSALLVEPGSPERLAEACASLLENATLRETLGRQAHEEWKRRFTSSHMAGEMLRLYRELTAEEEPTSPRLSRST